MRRALVGVVGVGLLALLLCAPGDVAQGQIKIAVPPAGPGAGPGAKPPATPGVVDLADKGRLTLPTDPKLKRRLQAVEDLIVSEDWPAVAKHIQELLDLSQDVFVQMPVKGADGKPVETLVGIRIAANRFVAGLPRDKPGVGLDVYRTVHGGSAKTLLAQALADGDKQKFADAAQRFLWTDAGAEAAERLATILLDRGDFMAAAQAFDRLIQRDGVEKLELLTLYKAAVAFHKGNSKEDQENKDKVWKQLVARAPDGFSVGGQTISLADAQQYLERIRGNVNTSIYDWPMMGGNPSRNGQGVGDTAFMQALWKGSLFGSDATNELHGWIDGANSAVKRLEDKNEAVIPAAAPVTATVFGKDGRPRSIIVFRGYDGVHALDMKTGKIQWNSPSVWSLEKMLKDGAKQQYVRQWVQQWLSKPNVILENSTIGTMSAESGRVYVIDDLQVPPHVVQPDPRWAGMPPPGMGGGFTPQINPGVQANKLQAFGVYSGKLLWTLGGPKADDDHANLKHDFRDSYFLGAPLCLGGKLYFLNENKDQLIRLVCYNPNKLPPERPTEKELDEAVVWVQPLGTAKEKILVDWQRRVTATHIAYGEGVLVCPTNAGVILGVDLLTHSLLWAHTYSDAQPTPPQPNPYEMGGFRGGRPIHQPAILSVSSDWKASPPIIADGKVVFTAPDGPDLKCLNLRNGAEVWKMKRADGDLYLAGVYAGRVVIVAKKDVRALALEDGRELWRVQAGMPSGRGVASDNVYYLPLKEALFSDKEKGPGIYAIDIEKGRVVAQTRSKKDIRSGAVEVPGNLTFFEGQVVSLSPTEVVAYPQLKVKLEQMNELLAKNDKDPKGLFERGELRLDKGERAGAVEDLHAALVNNPPADIKAKVQSRLFDAMTELLQHDFAKGEKYLAEYKNLCTVTPESPDKAEEARKETQRRLANYLCLVAQGREDQGRLKEALTDYLAFGSLPTAQDELLSTVSEPAVRAQASVWAQGRIKAMLDKATPEQRKPLEDEIAGQWTEVKGSGDLEKLRHFVNMFGSTAAIGKEGRLYLAERLVEREGRADLIDAELQYLRLTNDDDPGFVVRALDGLARLETRKGMLENAYKYYRDLKDRFGNVPVRDGKTGAQLFDELATDKRFLQYMDEPGDVGARPKFKGNEEHANYAMQAQHMLYTLDALNDAVPYLKNYRVAVNYSNNHLMLVDRRDGKEAMKEPLKGSFQHFMNAIISSGNVNQQAGRYGYQSVGELVVANLGQYVVAIDAVNHKVLWDKNLLGAQGVSGGTLQYNATDEMLQVWFPDNTILPVGRWGPVEATYACLQTRDGLMALDPLTGKVLWTRSDIPLRCRLFGDDRHVYLVELDSAGKASATRAFRAQDGAAVPVPPFGALYDKRQRIIGRELLVADQQPTGGVNLRLYDVQTGKDLWSQSFAAGAVVLQSQEPDLAGVIAPDGRVTIIDVRKRKVVLGAIVDTAHMKNVQQAHLLADGQYVYVAFHVNNPNNPWGVWDNLQPNTGLRSIVVSGEVYAFNRRTGKIVWHNPVENQRLVLEQWKDMPVLLFTSRFPTGVNGPAAGPRFNNGMQTIAIEVYGKATGRLEFRQPSPERAQLNAQQHGQIFSITHDVRNGKVEMIANNYKVTITQEGEATATGGGAADKGGKPAAQGGTSAGQAPSLPRAVPAEKEIIKE